VRGSDEMLKTVYMNKSAAVNLVLKKIESVDTANTAIVEV